MTKAKNEFLDGGGGDFPNPTIPPVGKPWHILSVSNINLWDFELWQTMASSGRFLLIT